MKISFRECLEAEDGAGPPKDPVRGMQKQASSTPMGQMDKAGNEARQSRTSKDIMYLKNGTGTRTDPLNFTFTSVIRQGGGQGNFAFFDFFHLEKRFREIDRRYCFFPIKRTFWKSSVQKEMEKISAGSPFSLLPEIRKSAMMQTMS